MSDRVHDARFPGESEDYRHARDELLRAELDLRRQTERVAALRRGLPPGGEIREDYVFDEWDGARREVRLSHLFGDKDTLFLYSFMFVRGEQGLPLEQGCPYCTSIIDAVDGEIPHISRGVAFAAVAKAPIEQFRAHAASRGWCHVRLLSSANSAYNGDYLAESADGDQLPMATVFVRDGDTIRHFWSSELFLAPTDPGQDPRHVDFLWPVWSALDCTPGGREGVELQLSY